MKGNKLYGGREKRGNLQGQQPDRINPEQQKSLWKITRGLNGRKKKGGKRKHCQTEKKKKKKLERGGGDRRRRRAVSRGAGLVSARRVKPTRRAGVRQSGPGHE